MEGKLGLDIIGSLKVLKITSENNTPYLYLEEDPNNNQKISDVSIITGGLNDIKSPLVYGRKIPLSLYDSYKSSREISDDKKFFLKYSPNYIIRPIITKLDMVERNLQYLNPSFKLKDGEKIEYGTYPFLVASNFRELENNFSSLIRTNNSYTFNENIDGKYNAVTYPEYEYKGRRYICMKSNISHFPQKLSNGQVYKENDYIWVEVLPITWIVDLKNGVLISEYGLFSGLELEDIEMFLDEYFEKDIIRSIANQQMQIDNKRIKSIFRKIVFKDQKSINEEYENPKVKKSRNYKYDTRKLEQLQIDREIIKHVASIVSADISKVNELLNGFTYIKIDAVTLCSTDSSNNITYQEQLNMSKDYDTCIQQIKRICDKFPDEKVIICFENIDMAEEKNIKIILDLIYDKKIGVSSLPDNTNIIAITKNLSELRQNSRLIKMYTNDIYHLKLNTRVNLDEIINFIIEEDLHPLLIADILFDIIESSYEGYYINKEIYRKLDRIIKQTGNISILEFNTNGQRFNRIKEFYKNVTKLEVIINNSNNYSKLPILIEDLILLISYLSKIDESYLNQAKELLDKIDIVNKKEELLIEIFEKLWSKNDEDRLNKLKEIKALGQIRSFKLN